MEGELRLVALLLYGGGLRLMECLQLRVKDVELGSREIRVRRGKGGKDRVTMLPDAARALLEAQLARVRALHSADLTRGGGAAPLSRKAPGWTTDLAWQWLFPARRTSRLGYGEGAPPSLAPECRTAADAGSSNAVRHREARDLSHAAALLRDPPVGGWLRHPKVQELLGHRT